MPKKKVEVADPSVCESTVITEVEYAEFVKYLTARNSDDPRVSQETAECFIEVMNGKGMRDLRDVFEVYIKLDRHAGEFWDLKNKRDSN